MRFFFLSLLLPFYTFLSAQEGDFRPNIVFLSGHYPIDTYFAQETRKDFEIYTARHGYGFYYEETEPAEKEHHALHFRRCEIIQKAFQKYPSAQWFVWVDSDVYVNRPELSLESQIDLSDTTILYHLFHEYPWIYPVNTGVKIVNKDALPIEQEMWDLRNTAPWNQFPFEQKTIVEYVLPNIPGRYIIHDPYVLNCILNLYPDKLENSLFAHMCDSTAKERNQIMLERNFVKRKQTYKKNKKKSQKKS